MLTTKEPIETPVSKPEQVAPKGESASSEATNAAKKNNARPPRAPIARNSIAPAGKAGGTFRRSPPGPPSTTIPRRPVTSNVSPRNVPVPNAEGQQKPTTLRRGVNMVGNVVDRLTTAARKPFQRSVTYLQGTTASNNRTPPSDSLRAVKQQPAQLRPQHHGQVFGHRRTTLNPAGRVPVTSSQRPNNIPYRPRPPQQKPLASDGLKTSPLAKIGDSSLSAQKSRTSPSYPQRGSASGEQAPFTPRRTLLSTPPTRISPPALQRVANDIRNSFSPKASPNRTTSTSSTPTSTRRSSLPPRSANKMPSPIAPSPQKPIVMRKPAVLNPVSAKTPNRRLTPASHNFTPKQTPKYQPGISVILDEEQGIKSDGSLLSLRSLTYAKQDASEARMKYISIGTSPNNRIASDIRETKPQQIGSNKNAAPRYSPANRGGPLLAPNYARNVPRQSPTNKYSPQGKVLYSAPRVYSKNPLVTAVKKATRAPPAKGPKQFPETDTATKVPPEKGPKQFPSAEKSPDKKIYRPRGRYSTGKTSSATESIVEVAPPAAIGSTSSKEAEVVAAEKVEAPVKESETEPSVGDEDCLEDCTDVVANEDNIRPAEEVAVPEQLASKSEITQFEDNANEVEPTEESGNKWLPEEEIVVNIQEIEEILNEMMEKIVEESEKKEKKETEEIKKENVQEENDKKVAEKTPMQSPSNASPGKRKRNSRKGKRVAKTSISPVQSETPIDATEAGNNATRSLAVVEEVSEKPSDVEKMKNDVKDTDASPGLAQSQPQQAEPDNAAADDHKVYDNFESDHWTLDHFELGKPLGQGKFGHVFLARTRKNKRIVALKILYVKQLMKYGIAKQMRREIEIQLKLRHPNVLKMHGYFTDVERVYLILDYAENGELYKQLTSMKRLDEPLTAKYICQLSEALHYCHSHGVIHRDIKPENVLIDKNGNVQLSDFGWSVINQSIQEKRTTMCGTLDYLSPEMAAGLPHDHTVDTWAVGVLCFECLVGKPTFEMKTEQETIAKIIECNVKFPKFVSRGARDLITKLVVREASKRMPLDKVKNHPWITSNAPDAIDCCRSGATTVAPSRLGSIATPLKAHK